MPSNVPGTLRQRASPQMQLACLVQCRKWLETTLAPSVLIYTCISPVPWDCPPLQLLHKQQAGDTTLLASSALRTTATPISTISVGSLTTNIPPSLSPITSSATQANAVHFRHLQSLPCDQSYLDTSSPVSFRSFTTREPVLTETTAPHPSLLPYPRSCRPVTSTPSILRRGRLLQPGLRSPLPRIRLPMPP